MASVTPHMTTANYRTWWPPISAVVYLGPVLWFCSLDCSVVEFIPRLVVASCHLVHLDFTRLYVCRLYLDWDWPLVVGIWNSLEYERGYGPSSLPLVLQTRIPSPVSFPRFTFPFLHFLVVRGSASPFVFDIVPYLVIFILPRGRIQRREECKGTGLATQRGVHRWNFAN
jgi:hypothetical protein